MKILSKLAVENDGIKTKCIENLISCLIIAYLGLKDSILSQNALQGNFNSVTHGHTLKAEC